MITSETGERWSHAPVGYVVAGPCPRCQRVGITRNCCNHQLPEGLGYIIVTFDVVDGRVTVLADPVDRLFVVASIHEGGDVCVRRATPREDAEERASGEGWAMSYESAITLAQESAQRNGCRWFDFSDDPAPKETPKNKEPS